MEEAIKLSDAYPVQDLASLSPLILAAEIILELAVLLPVSFKRQENAALTISTRAIIQRVH